MIAGSCRLIRRVGLFFVNFLSNYFGLDLFSCLIIKKRNDIFTYTGDKRHSLIANKKKDYFKIATSDWKKSLILFKIKKQQTKQSAGTWREHQRHFMGHLHHHLCHYNIQYCLILYMETNIFCEEPMNKKHTHPYFYIKHWYKIQRKLFAHALSIKSITHIFL